MKIGFDNDKYLAMQSEHIRERIKKFDNKLYLEFGGKLFDDYHASRVLPGFQPDSKLQMLLRGQNLLGYKHYPDDVVRMFVRKSVENGIDIIRIFDALNDIRNIEVAVDETLKCGAHASGCICYTISPIHNLESYVKLAKEIEALGVQSICVKDMAGIMSPKEAYDLVTALKKEIKVPIVIHTHNTTGLGPMTLMKAVEAGADVIDTAVSCFSGGTSQPPTETLVYALREMGYEISVKDDVVKKINDFFKPIRAKYLANGLLNPVVMGNATDALIYQVPGGMLSNLISQLRWTSWMPFCWKYRRYAKILVILRSLRP